MDATHGLFLMRAATSVMAAYQHTLFTTAATYDVINLD